MSRLWFKKIGKSRGMNLNRSLLRHVHYGKWLLAAFWVAVLAGAFTGWWRLHLNLVGLVLAPVGLYVCV